MDTPPPVRTCNGPTCPFGVSGRADRRFHADRCRHDRRLWDALWGRYAEAGVRVAERSRKARASRWTG